MASRRGLRAPPNPRHALPRSCKPPNQLLLLPDTEPHPRTAARRKGLAGVPDSGCFFSGPVVSSACGCRRSAFADQPLENAGSMVCMAGVRMTGRPRHSRTWNQTGIPQDSRPARYQPREPGYRAGTTSSQHHPGGRGRPLPWSWRYPPGQYGVLVVMGTNRAISHTKAQGSVLKCLLITF